MYKAPEKCIIGGSEWYVRAILNKETSSNNEQQFLRIIYNQYVSIRRALGGNKCSKMPLSQVKELLENSDNREQIKQSLHMTDESLDTILYVSENYIKMVR